ALHSFPTRRSSDLGCLEPALAEVTVGGAVDHVGLVFALADRSQALQVLLDNRALGLEGGRVHIGDVVGHDIELPLKAAHPREADVSCNYVGHGSILVREPRLNLSLLAVKQRFPELSLVWLCGTLWMS